MIASIRNVESDVLTETLVINDAVGKIETLARLNRSIFYGGIFLNYIFIHKKSQFPAQAVTGCKTALFAK